MSKALEKHAPAGYSLHSFQSSGELEDILEPLSEGNPVVALVSLGELNLHWVTVVGYYRNDEGQLILRVANLNSDVTWDEWKGFWSLKSLTGKIDGNLRKVIRKILKDVGAYKPYTMMYYSKDGSNWDVEYDVDPREAEADEICHLTWNRYNPSEPPKYAFLSTTGGPHCGYRKLEEQDAIPHRDNVALNKTATQSSTVFNVHASRAVDGNTDGDWKNGSVSQTTIENRAWWRVDLGSSHRVDGVTIWNRTDCCADKLADFHVDYLDSQGRVIATNNHKGRAGTRTNIHLAATDVYAVRVQLNGNDSLVLAEVQVWGAENVAVGKQASQSSTILNGYASRAVDGNTDGNWFNGSVTHTNNDQGAWWMVDLGGDYDVTGVTIWNRTDSSSDRLMFFYVDYLDDSGNIIESHLKWSSTTENNIPLAAGGVQAVRVRFHRAEYLSLAEVQVWGSKTFGPIMPIGF